MHTAIASEHRTENIYEPAVWNTMVAAHPYMDGYTKPAHAFIENSTHTYIHAHHATATLVLQLTHVYCRSGNFRVEKLSYDKFSCKKNFIGTTPYRISINSAR